MAEIRKNQVAAMTTSWHSVASETKMIRKAWSQVGFDTCIDPHFREESTEYFAANGGLFDSLGVELEVEDMEFEPETEQLPTYSSSDDDTESELESTQPNTGVSVLGF